VIEAEPYTQEDLLHVALRGERLDPIRVAATFAKRENWTQLYQDQRCWWSWVGPVVPPFELAQNMFRQQKQRA
jgi:hypothetical protein